MERNLKKLLAVLLLCTVLCTVLSACTRIPRPEEGSTESQTVTEEPSDTAKPTDGDETPDPETDANGFPNEAEDGYTKRY